MRPWSWSSAAACGSLASGPTRSIGTCSSGPGARSASWKGASPDGGPLKAFDLGYREGSEVKALNCIHAVSDIVREPIPLRTWLCYGDEAARRVVLHLRREIKDTAAESLEAWTMIWKATWQGSPAWSSERIARGNPKSRPGTEASDGRPEDTAGVLTLRKPRDSDPGRANRAARSAASSGGS